MLGAAAGAAALSIKTAIGMAAVLVGAIAFRVLGTKRLLWLLVGSTFITLYRIDVAGANLRLEHFVLVACLVALVLEGGVRALIDVAGDRTMLLFGAFILWSASVAMVQAPEPGDSLMIVAWLALDWLMLAVLVSSFDDAKEVAGVGATWAGIAGAVGVGVWILAFGLGSSFGVTQTSDALSGARSAYGLSFEPNLLGATMAMWAVVVFTGCTRLSKRARTAVVAIASAAIVLSFTRAAGIGLLAGLLVWALAGGSRALRKSATLLASIAAVMFVLATFAPQLAEPVTVRASQAFDFDSGTGKIRVQLWEAALDDLKGYDLAFGLGADTFGHRHFDPTVPGQPAYLGNLPLQVLYETGIVGVVLLGATVISLFTRRRLRDGRALGLLAVYLICASATSPFWYGTTWVLVAIAMIDRRQRDRRDDAEPAPPAPPVRAFSVR
jgi:hypothetical protein